MSMPNPYASNRLKSVNKSRFITQSIKSFFPSIADANLNGASLVQSTHNPRVAPNNCTTPSLPQTLPVTPAINLSINNLTRSLDWEFPDVSSIIQSPHVNETDTCMPASDSNTTDQFTQAHYALIPCNARLNQHQDTR